MAIEYGIYLIIIIWLAGCISLRMSPKVYPTTSEMLLLSLLSFLLLMLSHCGEIRSLFLLSYVFS